MKKRRVTPDLDEDVVEALEAIGGKRLSAAVSDALGEAVADEAHRAALLRWLDELDQEYGAPTEADLAAADALLDEVKACVREAKRPRPAPASGVGRRQMPCRPAGA